MTRYTTVILCIITAFSVAACATPAEPTQTPATGSLPSSTSPTPEVIEATSDGTQIVPTPQEVGLAETLVPGGAVTLIAPGMVILPEVTEPADPSQPLPQFERLVLSAIRGFDGPELIVELRADGTLIRNGVIGAVAPSEVQAVVTTLDNLRFYDFIGSFSGPLQTNDAYRYVLTIYRTGVNEYVVPAMEAYTPSAYLRLYTGIAQLGIQPFPAP
jgi:hypothetical protein